MKLRTLLCAVLCASPSLAHSQALTGTSLTLTGPQNSQELGGKGSAGDASCPQPSSLTAGQFAACYIAKDGAWELAYPGGSYSPIARQADLLSLQAAQTAVTAQVSTLTQQVASLQAAQTQTAAQLATIIGQLSAPQTATKNYLDATGLPMLDVLGAPAMLSSRAFVPVPLAVVQADSASGFNRNSYSYVVPTAGNYLVITKLRLVDGTPAGISYGQSAGVAPIDTTAFVWGSTTAQPQSQGVRNALGNTSVQHFNAGDSVGMYAYVDSPVPVKMLWAEMTIVRVGN